MKIPSIRRVAVAVGGIAVLASLASCGGSGGGDNGAVIPPPVATSNTPPASASSSVGNFIAYLKTIVTIKDDTISPLDVSAFVAPTSDNTEPDLTI